MTAPIPAARPTSAGQFVEWHNLFIVIDDGAISMQRYDAIEVAMTAMARRYPDGFVCMVVLPPGASPPPPEGKLRIKTLLGRLEPSLRALAYVIEDTGFTAVAARAALVGMKIFAPRPYKIHVETSLDSATAKVLPQLKRGRAVLGDARVIALSLEEARARWETPTRLGGTPPGLAQVGKTA